MKPVANTLDPTQFSVFPGVFVLDEFEMVRGDGAFVATINEQFLDRFVAHMNEREQMTGDLSPLVIGHTTADGSEVEQPQVIGFARNWRTAPFFETGKVGAACDYWVYKKNTFVIDGKEVELTAEEVVKRWPRRSAEVWADRYEADPISLLGATTPCRDLGLIKLSRSGSFVYTSPCSYDGEKNMPDDKKPDDKAKNDDKPKADPKESGANADIKSTLDQILALLTKLAGGVDVPGTGADAGAAGAAPAAAGAAGAEGAEGAGQGDELSDEELEKLLSDPSMSGGEGAAGAGAGAGEPEDRSRKQSEPPVQNSGYPGGNDTNVRLSRIESENADLKVKLSRMEVQKKLQGMKEQGYEVNPDDEAFVADLIAMPPDIRDRQLARVTKLSRKDMTQGSFTLDNAVDNSNDGNLKRIPSREEMQRLVKLAREKNTSFEAVAREHGYLCGK